ncbi:MAG: hypothetical protein WDN76_03050 [Alphaproteobacteria bacterium]
METSRSGLVQNIRPDNPNVHAYSNLDLTTQMGQAMADALVNRQAAMQAYVDDFRILVLVSIFSVPLLLLVRTPKKNPNAPKVAHAVAD